MPPNEPPVINPQSEAINQFYATGTQLLDNLHAATDFLLNNPQWLEEMLIADMAHCICCHICQPSGRDVEELPGRVLELAHFVPSLFIHAFQRAVFKALDSEINQNPLARAETIAWLEANYPQQMRDVAARIIKTEADINSPEARARFDRFFAEKILPNWNPVPVPVQALDSSDKDSAS